MERNEIMDKLQVFCKEELDIENLISAEDCMSDIGIDSIGFMMIVVFIEEEFHIEIDDILSEEGSSMTFRELADYIITCSGGKDGTTMD